MNTVHSAPSWSSQLQGTVRGHAERAASIARGQAASTSQSILHLTFSPLWGVWVDIAPLHLLGTSASLFRSREAGSPVIGRHTARDIKHVE